MSFVHTPMMGSEEYELITQLIADHCGLQFDERQKYLIEKRLARRMAALSLTDYKTYFQRLVTDRHRGGGGELALAIQELTNHETYFFRESAQLTTFADIIFPEIAAANPRVVNLWVAGCSTGEEAWSLAILAVESGIVPAGRIQIHANDISSAVLKTAREGVYSSRAFRGQGLGLRQDLLKRKYFTEREPDRFEVRPELRKVVNFFQMNLLDASRMGLMTRMDAIFCRNVIIYFSRETRRQVIGDFWRKMRPGGYLMLGHSETLSGVNDDFQLKNINDQLVYWREREAE